MKKALFPVLTITVLLLCNSGWGAAWEFLKTLAYAVYSFLVMLLPFLDMEQTLICKIVTIGIVQVLCGAGFYVSWKTQSRIGAIVSGIADAISTILLLIA